MVLEHPLRMRKKCNVILYISQALNIKGATQCPVLTFTRIPTAGSVGGYLPMMV
jgi:hypothetical protein